MFARYLLENIDTNLQEKVGKDEVIDVRKVLIRKHRYEPLMNLLLGDKLDGSQGTY